MKTYALALVIVILAPSAFADGKVVAPGQQQPKKAAAEFDYAHADVATMRAHRVELAKQAYDTAVSRMLAGVATFDAVLSWGERLRDAEAAIDARSAAAHDLERAKVIEPIARDRVNAGVASADTLLAVQWWRATAELALKQ